MKTNYRNMAVSALTLAVQGALAAMVAMPTIAQADEDDLASLTNPTNYVEAGVGNTSDKSAKFGEYNGLPKKGADLIGNFSVKGGDSYGQGLGTRRWAVTGTDVGTTSRELGATMGDQGKWNLGINYDELRHNITDTYQTPFQGSMGGNNFTLPANFGVIQTTTTNVGGVLTSASKGTQTLTATQLAAFNTPDVHSDRHNTSFKAGFDFDRQWSVQFDFNRLDQSGAKLMAFSSDNFNPGPSGYRWTAEAPVILMNPTDYKTDTYNLALNWTGDQGYATASYFGSNFHDNNAGVSWNTPYVRSAALPGVVTGTLSAFPTDTLSTPPSNMFHQLNLTGGYAFDSATKLAGGLSYSRNTQNDSFAGTYTTTPNTVTVLPVSSPNALVVSKHFDLKLTNKTTKDLTLAAGVKYDERDNRTASNTYTYLDLGGVSRNAVNTPMSNKRSQLELTGDYRIDQSQKLRAAYEYDNIKRWCNNPLANNAQGVLSATNTGYYTDASCVQIPQTKENKLALDYKLKASDVVDVNAGYAYAKRKADVNAAFYNPMQGVNEGFENFGYRAFFDASRKEDLYKAGVNWQANEKLTMGLSGKFMKDTYTDSPLGVQTGKTSSFNLDASYAYTDQSTVSAYITQQDRSRDLSTSTGRNAVSIAGLTFWSNKLTDESTTFGIAGKQTGLFGGKWDLKEDLTYSSAKSHYSTTLQTVPAAVGNSGDTPDIKSDLTQFKLTAGYHLDKASEVVMGYMHQRLKSNDYFYNAYQYGYTPTSILPTNQQDPSYSVNYVFAAYKYSFK